MPLQLRHSDVLGARKKINVKVSRFETDRALTRYRRCKCMSPPKCVRVMKWGTDMSSKRSISVWLQSALSKIARANLPTLMMIAVLAAIGLAGYAMFVICTVVVTLLGHVTPT